MEKGFRIWRRTLSQLFTAHGIIQSFPLDWTSQTHGTHSGILYRYPSQFPVSQVYFQKEITIICFSPDFLRILQKE